MQQPIRTLNFCRIFNLFNIIRRGRNAMYEPGLSKSSLRAGSRRSTRECSVAASAKSSGEAARRESYLLGASSPDPFPPDRSALRRSRVCLKGEPARRLLQKVSLVEQFCARAYKCLYIILPSSAKQQREMTKLYLV